VHCRSITKAAITHNEIVESIAITSRKSITPVIVTIPPFPCPSLAKLTFLFIYFTSVLASVPFGTEV